MNKKLRALVDQDILTIEEAIEYEELMICERFFSLVNQQIDIEPEPVEPKHYYFDKSKNRFIVQVTTNGKQKKVGQYVLEQDAINKVQQLKKEGVIL